MSWQLGLFSARPWQKPLKRVPCQDMGYDLIVQSELPVLQKVRLGKCGSIVGNGSQTSMTASDLAVGMELSLLNTRSFGLVSTENIVSSHVTTNIQSISSKRPIRGYHSDFV